MNCHNAFSKSWTHTAVLAGLLLTMLAGAASAGTFYVSPTGNDAHSGASADQAKQTIQAAITAAALSGDTVVLEDGTYTGAGNWDLTFADGQSITLQSQNGAAKTRLDGSGGNAGDHRAFDINDDTVIVTGLTIQNFSQSNDAGGGVRIANNSAVLFQNCVFRGDYAFLAAGGIYNSDSLLDLTDCLFTQNSTGSDGSAVLNDYVSMTSYVTATNCVFTSNLSAFYGSVFDNNLGTATLTGCTFTANSAPQGGCVTNWDNLTLANDILYADTVSTEIAQNSPVAVTSCDVQGGFNGTGNIAADPLFACAPGNVHLSAGSPCFGMGSNAALAYSSTDFDGAARAATPALGAYEAPSPVPATHFLWRHLSDGAAMVINVDAQGSTTSRTYGPFPTWTPKAIATGPDGSTRLLWNRNDGVAQVWTLDPQANFVTATYGFGPYAGWSANALAVDQDNNIRLLWVRSDGVAQVWTVDSADNVTSTYGFGPYTNWTPTALAVGPDNLSRVLWNRTDGVAQVWTIDSLNNVTSTYGYGPYTNWAATALAVGPDNQIRVLWNRTDGVAQVWTIDSLNNVTSTYGYGPYTNWAPNALTVGPDSLTRVLWSCSGGIAQAWTIDNSDNVAAVSSTGLDSTWTAVGVSAGP